MRSDTGAYDSAIPIVSRVALASLFVVSGVTKGFAFGDVVQWIEGQGLPFPTAILALTLFLEIGGGALLAIGWQARALAITFAIFTVAAAVLFHRFWVADAGNFDNELAHFLKNVGLFGGLIALSQLEARSLRRGAFPAGGVTARYTAS